MATRVRSSYQAVVELDPPPINLVAGPSWRTCLALAARHWGVAEAVILGTSRDTLAVAARHHAMWLMRTHMGASLLAIGRRFGRDHTTVIAGLEAHEARVAGRRPRPYAWHREGVAQFRRLVLAGRNGRQARVELGMTDGDLMRCPEYHQLIQEAVQINCNRQMQHAIAGKAVAKLETVDA